MIKTILVIIILVLIVVWAILYIIKEKKNGKKCIGCPYCDECPKYKDLYKDKILENKEENK